MKKPLKRGKVKSTACASNKNKTFHRKAFCATHWLLSHLFNLYGGKRQPLQFYMTGFHLDQMPLGSSIGGKRKRLLRVLGTLLMLFDRKSALLKIFVVLRIALNKWLASMVKNEYKKAKLCAKQLASRSTKLKFWKFPQNSLILLENTWKRRHSFLCSGSSIFRQSEVW